jgi:signal transduction histidine kinase
MYGFQSYISMPIIRRDGSMFGTLCAIDPKPHRLKTPGTIGMFKLFAELIATHIDSTDRLASSEASLLDERRRAELREQFIAVLGHDLRNPLAAIDAGTKLLLKTQLNDKGLAIVGAMQRSAARMTGLINDVLDLARGRLGGGFKLQRDAEEPLQPVLDQVIAELRTAWPDREITAEFDIAAPINCDRARVAQLCSNLVANAVKHGSTDAPVQVQAIIAEGVLKLSVANTGEPIPPFALNRLFQPFTRGPGSGNPQGLGLGLYIASEIARAHGGMLTVSSSIDETRFVFQMPLH